VFLVLLELHVASLSLLLSVPPEPGVWRGCVSGVGGGGVVQGDRGSSWGVVVVVAGIGVGRSFPGVLWRDGGSGGRLLGGDLLPGGVGVGLLAGLMGLGGAVCVGKWGEKEDLTKATDWEE
jgi:hypothetical protein